MKIKIIDLLIKIAKKEAPKRIKFQNKIWDFDNDAQDYNDRKKYLLADYMNDYIYKSVFLNEEVEIIEEEKEIEKIGKIYDGFTDSYYDTCLETTIKKVDEIIDVVNKIKKEIEKENR